MIEPVAPSILTTLQEREFISRPDALVAARICRVVGEPADAWPVALVALAIRAVRDGSTALNLTSVADMRPDTGDDVVPPEDDSAREDGDAAHEPTGTNRLCDVVMVPPTDELQASIEASPLTAAGVVHVEFGLVYLDRYYRDEVLIAQSLHQRESVPLTPADTERALAALDAHQVNLDGTQRRAVTSVLTSHLTVLTGGPGMGKTHTLAGVLLAIRAGLPATTRVALAAPTGKAAARMTQALEENGVTGDVQASTLHRLLGFVPRNHTRFVHNRANPLPHDVVIVDEASMVSLSLIARLVEALKPSARLLLVGDPDQLASVDAGTVLGDLIDGLPSDHVVRLTKDYRLAGGRVQLAQAFRNADPDEVLAAFTSSDTRASDTAADIPLSKPSEPRHDTLASDTVAGNSLAGKSVAGKSSAGDSLADGPAGTTAEAELTQPDAYCKERSEQQSATSGHLRLVETDSPSLGMIPDVVAWAVRLHKVAARGDVDGVLNVLNEARLLCAHRSGPFGVRRWNRLIEQALTAQFPYLAHASMYPGRPLLITENDRTLGLYNGDTGVLVSTDQGLVAVIATATGARRFSPWRLGSVETMYAMTIHKAQGSQASNVTVIVPPVGSRLLSRELLYTAATRSLSDLSLIGSPDAVRLAVRTPLRRASGLGQRLRTVFEPSGVTSA